MTDQFSRSRLLLGSEGIEKLNNSRVIVFGVGGVGSYTVEALARAGVGKIDIVDNDTVSETNINRQLIALHSTVGESKVEVSKRRILDINPKAEVTAYKVFFSLETEDSFDLTEYDYVVDAVDTVSAKLRLAEICNEHNIPIISSMGTGNKFDPTKFRVADINKTSGCPLARVMRYELRKRGIKKLKVVFSDEEARKPAEEREEVSDKKNIPGSLSFVPPVAGLIIAGEVIKDITGQY